MFATRNWPSETTRTWSRPIVPDAAVVRRVDALWAVLQAARTPTTT
jgi:4-hydroxy-3-polyprenylbenzoate decarboxylase